MRRSTLTKRGLFLAGCTLLVAAAWFLLFSSDNHERASARFVELLRRQDWGAIFDQAPSQEFERIPLSRDQYVAFASTISRELPSDWEKIQIDDRERYEKNLNGGQYGFLVLLPFTPKRTDVEPKLMLHAHRLKDRWAISPAGLPVRLAKLSSKDSVGTVRLLLRAMEAANIEKFPTDLDRTVLSRRALEKYLENPEIKPDIYVRG